MKVYHVTPVCNLAGIKESCLNPELAQGKLKAVWFVDRQHLVWAIAHTSNRHGVKIDLLVAIEKNIDVSALTKYREGVFYSRNLVPLHPFKLLRASTVMMLDESGVWERYEDGPGSYADAFGPLSGIDWDAIRVALNTPDDYDGNDERWRLVGDLQNLLPSRRFYDITALGVDVDLATVAQDAAWLRLARQEAEARGWKLHTEEYSQTVWISAPVVVV